jgi:hypothetical protein
MGSSSSSSIQKSPFYPSFIHSFIHPSSHSTGISFIHSFTPIRHWITCSLTLCSIINVCLFRSIPLMPSHGLPKYVRPCPSLFCFVYWGSNCNCNYINPREWSSWKPKPYHVVVASPFQVDRSINRWRSIDSSIDRSIDRRRRRRRGSIRWTKPTTQVVFRTRLRMLPASAWARNRDDGQKNKIKQLHSEDDVRRGVSSSIRGGRTKTKASERRNTTAASPSPQSPAYVFYVPPYLASCLRLGSSSSDFGEFPKPVLISCPSQSHGRRLSCG